MKLISILSGLLIIQAGIIKGENCDGVTVNGVCHKQEILLEDLKFPTSLTVDLKSNVLYFARISSDLGNPTSRLNLDTKEFKNIEGIYNAYTLAVDRNSHDVYIGRSDRIYKYDAVDDKATFIGAEGNGIGWGVYYKDVYYKDVLYYTLSPSDSLYTFENGVSKKYPDLEDTIVDRFLIHDEFNYFANATGLYSHKKGTKDIVFFNTPVQSIIIGFTLDTKGMVHICLKDGVYVVKKDSLTVEKIVDLHDVSGCAFDKNNNIVYSDATKLVRLLPVQVKLHIM